jgi:hypothetical protein
MDIEESQYFIVFEMAKFRHVCYVVHVFGKYNPLFWCCVLESATISIPALQNATFANWICKFTPSWEQLTSDCNFCLTLLKGFLFGKPSTYGKTQDGSSGSSAVHSFPTKATSFSRNTLYPAIVQEIAVSILPLGVECSRWCATLLVHNDPGVVGYSTQTRGWTYLQ